MRVLITGSRHWSNEDQIIETLVQMQEDLGYFEIAHGASRGGGVDLIVDRACRHLGIPQQPFPVIARDGNHRGAPLNRNKRMVLSWMPDLVIAFRSQGKSNGTDQCLAFAESLGYATKVIHEKTGPYA